jgi:heme-degrading monooxygenase HmoA/predicted ester cyclase
MHARVNMLAGDPALLTEATRYLEGTVRPHVEGQPGNRGIACLANAELGTCVITSYWDSLEAMTASEQAVQVSRKELTERLRGSVTVEHYEVPVFVRRFRPERDAGVRFTRVECPPGHMDAFIDEFRGTAIPSLMDMPGMSSAHLLTDRGTGRCVVITSWQDMKALAANRAAAARLRADASATLHIQIRGVEEYALVFTSVREGDTRSLIQRDMQLWNARDRDGWMSGMDLLRFETQSPGGRLSGKEAADTMWSTWQQAFPDNRIETIAIHADDRGGVHEFRAIGTHTGTLRGPAGEIPATGRAVRMSMCGVYQFDDAKIIGFHLYFDHAELLRQLGLAGGS